MKRLPVVVMTGVLCLCAAPAAAQAAAPTAPTNLTATVAAEGNREATVDLAWTASSDPDADAVTYDVQTRDFDAITVTKSSTNSLRLTLPRGREMQIAVSAVDATGAASATSNSTTVNAPPIAVRLVFGVSLRGGLAQSCAGVARACAVADPAKASVKVRAFSTATLTDARTQLTVLWRRAGATRFVVRPSVVASISAGSASISLGRIVTAPGTWCMRARLAPNAGDLVGRSAFTPTCVSYSLTPIMG